MTTYWRVLCVLLEINLEEVWESPLFLKNAPCLLQYCVYVIEWPGFVAISSVTSLV